MKKIYEYLLIMLIIYYNFRVIMNMSVHIVTYCCIVIKTVLLYSYMIFV